MREGIYWDVGGHSTLSTMQCQPVTTVGLLLVCLLHLVESRQGKDFALLRSVQPVELAREENGTAINISESNNVNLVEAEKIKNDTNDPTRDSRGLMKKLHYLAGMKTGGLISSSGTLAASNSLRIFGKVMNTALSVSYGHVNDVDALPEIESDHSQGGDSGEKDVRLKTEVTTQSALNLIRKQFLKNHNAQVSRINHKFLRSDSFGRAS